jgi:hypothetical protein
MIAGSGYIAVIFAAVSLGALLLWRRADASSKRLQSELDQSRGETRQIADELERRSQRFAGVIDADAEEARVRAALAQEEARARAALAEQIDELEGLRSSYREKRAIYDAIVAQLAIFDERLSFAEMGVYEPHFDFTDSEEFKAAIVVTRDQQKSMISAKSAVFCTKNWTVDGSQSKGQTMTNRNIRLTLRAFNNECDAAIANTRWNNANAMVKRIENAREQIDKLNASNAVVISEAYAGLKLKELRLTHEYREKLKAEREERAELARLAREEQKLLRDLEKAQEEEAYYGKLLDKAKAEAAKSVGPQLDAYAKQIQTLEKDLSEAHAKAERAKAMAEQTRSGYVYVISNIGSFGEGIVKIGLTRRLDPLDRVRELGDASVPFSFDTHAVIYSDDAPALEKALHDRFESTRINVQNARKEFFRASIADVETAVMDLAPAATFFTDVEAQEYRETLARREAALAASQRVHRETFPAEL